MIVGIGTDIVQINRIEAVLAKYGDAFSRRILSERELNTFQLMPVHKHASFLAKRFAAKEAISKALGTGITGNLSFKDIIIFNNASGKPCAEFSPNYSTHNLKIELSIADDYPTALAFAIVTS